MSPRQSVDYGKYVSPAGGVLVAQLIPRHTASMVCSKLDYLSLRKLVCSGPFAALLPLLRYHVAYIVRLSSKKQMAWIHAGWLVAAMKNLESFRDDAIAENPSGPISKEYRSLAGNYGPVTASVYASSPHPAIASNAYLFPEAIWECFREAVRSENWVFVKWNSLVLDLAKLSRCSSVFPHKSVLLICAALPDAQTSRGQFAYI